MAPGGWRALAPQGGPAGRHQARDLCRIVGAGGRWWPAARSARPRPRRKARPLGILTSAAVALGEKVLMDLAREVVSHVGVEGADLGRRHAARVRGAVPWRGAVRGERC